MALTRLDDKACTYPITKTPSVDGLYERYLQQVPQSTQDDATRCIDEKIHNVDRFSLATHFGDPWPDELESLYVFCKDEKLAAFLLASLVIDRLIHSEANWLCTKTNIQDRDFASNFYWIV